MKQKALRLLGIFMLCLGALTAVAQQKDHVALRE